MYSPLLLILCSTPCNTAVVTLCLTSRVFVFCSMDCSLFSRAKKSCFREVPSFVSELTLLFVFLSSCSKCSVLFCSLATLCKSDTPFRCLSNISSCSNRSDLLLRVVYFSCKLSYFIFSRKRNYSSSFGIYHASFYSSLRTDVVE